jgi:hypothetical protein|tara:strand:+ start:96 stop:299 length:204 start_codon:yes stop_codon:yes gene_type:complete
MSRELANIIKILFVTFFLVFVWESAIAKTITMNVDGKELIKITVLEEITVTEEDTKEKDTEEEPDCE